MIVDTLRNADRYEQLPAIGQALRFLKEAALLPPTGRVVIDGERMFANPVSLVSKPVEDCVFEAHRRYMDVHYILSGVEGISIQEVGQLSPIGTFEEERDIGFYEGEPVGTWYLRPGEFLLCWPNEAHRVAMMQNAPGEIKKIVVKIAVV